MQNHLVLLSIKSKSRNTYVEKPTEKQAEADLGRINLSENQAPRTFVDLMPIMQLNDKKEQERIALKLNEKKRRHRLKKGNQSVENPAKNELRKYFPKLSSKPGKIDTVNMDSPAVKDNELMNLNVQHEPGFQDSDCKLGELGSLDDSNGGALTPIRPEAHRTFENDVHRSIKCSKRKREKLKTT